MTLGTLKRYLQRQRDRADRGNAEGALVAVEVANPRYTSGVSSGGLTVVLSGQRKIEVGAGFDAHTLQRLIALLEKM